MCDEPDDPTPSRSYGEIMIEWLRHLSSIAALSARRTIAAKDPGSCTICLNATDLTIRILGSLTMLMSQFRDLEESDRFNHETAAHTAQLCDDWFMVSMNCIGTMSDAAHAQLKKIGVPIGTHCVEGELRIEEQPQPRPGSFGYYTKPHIDLRELDDFDDLEEETEDDEDGDDEGGGFNPPPHLH